MPNNANQYSYTPSNEIVFSGMRETEQRLGLLIKNNIKHANTVGFKSVFTNSILLDPEGASNFRNESQGVIIRTPNSPLNMALDGENAFFLVEGPSGPERTRDGHFHLDKYSAM